MSLVQVPSSIQRVWAENMRVNKREKKIWEWMGSTFFFLFTFCNIQFMYYNSLFIIDFCFNYVPLTMISHLYIYIYIYIYIVRAGFGSKAQKMNGLRPKEPNTMNL